MSIVIQKYGGTSVGSVERMRHVCELIAAEKQAGNDVVVVVSAMAGETNRLVSLASQFSNSSNSHAYDFLVSTGETVSCGMLSLALKEHGIAAMPLAGWQVPIYTTDTACRASIKTIDVSKIRSLLADGVVPVITGFQGVSMSGKLTTLGRGGSDTSAAALAQYLDAQRCDIYTDIDGIYTADPRIVSNAQRIACVPFGLALRMSQLGAKVIHPRAVECAMKANVDLRVLSSFGSSHHSVVSDVEGDACAITHSVDNVVFSVTNAVGDAAFEKIMRNLQDQDIPLDVWACSLTNLLISISGSDIELVESELNAYSLPFTFQRGCKVSVVGTALDLNMHNEVLSVLNKQQVKCLNSVMGEGRVSVIVPQDQLTIAVNSLHATFLENLTEKD